MIIRSKAPLRISFSGGGTDVPPYPAERGGVVLSTTIDRYAYGTLMTSEEPGIRVNSLDFGMVARYHAKDLVYDGELDLVKSVIKHMGAAETNLDMILHSDAPPGSGLGSSSTLVVALIGLLAHYLRREMTPYDVASLAYHVERVDLGIKGGIQDQYAAAFGGFNLIEFHRDGVVVNPLRIPRDIMNELQYRLILCFTGRTRLSANIIETQVKGYLDKQGDVMAALDELKSLTLDMKNVLLKGRLSDFGGLLHDAWLNKKKLAKAISNDNIDDLYEMARKAGALGGKILGAGGGGYMLLMCDYTNRNRVAEALEGYGAPVIPFAFDQYGLQTWTANAAEIEDIRRVTA